jgi:hypothetical protein
MRSSEMANSAVMAIWLASWRWVGASQKGRRAQSQKIVSIARHRERASRCATGS